MDKVETLARLLCAEHDIDPDKMFIEGEYDSGRLNDEVLTLLPADVEPKPIWIKFKPLARKIIAAGFDNPDLPTTEPQEPAEEEEAPVPSQSDDWRARMGLA